MKKIQVNIIILLSLLSLSTFLLAQESVPNDLHFEINRVYPFIAITKAEIKEAQKLIDINPHYEESWVKEYKFVEIRAFINGKLTKVRSNKDVLTEEQKNLMDQADVGTEIAVEVEYLPANNLIQNDLKHFNFSFIPDPESNATYTAGLDQLNQDLKKQVIGQIPNDLFTGYALAAVTFSIDEAGHISEPKLFWTSNDEQVDDLLVNAIRDMPSWKPASYTDGTKAKQEFALTVGNMENCVVNLLNIRKD